MSTTPSTLDQLLNAAIAEHQGGRLQQAEGLYREILRRQPDHARAMMMLGVLAGQVNHPQVAEQLLRQAVQVQPGLAEGWLHLGNLLQAQSRLAEAVTAFERVIALVPGSASGYCNLSNAMNAMGRHQDAVSAAQRAIALHPTLPEAHNNLGNATTALGQHDQAIGSYRRAIELNPRFSIACFNLGNAYLATDRDDLAAQAFGAAAAHQPAFFAAQLNLGLVLKGLGRLDEAIVALSMARTLEPNHPSINNDLGVTLQARGRLAEAIDCYRAQVKAHPADPFGHNNLGSALLARFEVDAAIPSLRKAMELDPNDASAHSNLAVALKDCGQVSAALESFRRALQLKPESSVIHSKLIYSMYFDPDQDAAAIGRECARWNDSFALPLTQAAALHSNTRDPNRKLRIGYVSPNFHAHSETHFVLPLLEHHDHTRFEVHGYSSVAVPDSTTARHQAAVSVWHNVLGKTDAQLAAQIRQDQIDILVDVTMHMADNRLLTFAHKPAPVRVCWLAYPGTTGLTAMTHRLSDRLMDPPEIPTPFYSERTVHLPDCWVAFDPLIDVPSAAPRAGETPICFGSLNNPCKLNPPILRHWAELLRQVPNSQLLILAISQIQRQEIQRIMGQETIAPSRIEFVGYLPRVEYFRLYDRIDIALDPLPYNGITTTLEALWMGVPVVSLAGDAAAGRAGLAMLHCLGLPELGATTSEEFIQIATCLAGDTERLSALRRSLRDRMKASTLMDGAGFARKVEGAYRVMWEEWCAAARE